MEQDREAAGEYPDRWTLIRDVVVLQAKPVWPRVLSNRLRRPHRAQATDAAPAEFLPWLAGWVALGLRDDWREKDKRQIMRDIVSNAKKIPAAVATAETRSTA